jgi:CubicO group peptidase (beta-lactamase class C family)
VRSKDYWADGGLVSTPTEMVAFLRALNEGKIISAGSLRTMQTWHARDGSPTPPAIPGAQYGYGLWNFHPTGAMAGLSGVEPTWGARVPRPSACSSGGGRPARDRSGDEGAGLAIRRRR